MYKTKRKNLKRKKIKTRIKKYKTTKRNITKKIGGFNLGIMKRIKNTKTYQKYFNKPKNFELKEINRKNNINSNTDDVHHNGDDDEDDDEIDPYAELVNSRNKSKGNPNSNELKPINIE